MESTQKFLANQNAGAEDIDLSHLFSKTLKGFRLMASWLRVLFKKVVETFLVVCIFLLKNIGWLVAGLLIGAFCAFYFAKEIEPQYSYSLTMRTNFNSSQALYASVDLINAQVRSKEKKEIESRFKISSSDASKIIRLTVEPLKSEITVIELYKKQFSGTARVETLSNDTPPKTVDYSTFSNNLTGFDYPVHKINLLTSAKISTEDFQNGIINYISSIKFLQQLKDSATKINEEEIRLLSNYLINTDRSRNEYVKTFQNNSIQRSGYDINLADGHITYQLSQPELHDKFIILVDELKAAKSKAALENDIIKIYSPMELAGFTDKSINRPILNYSLIGLGLSALGLLLIAFYKYLRKFQKQKELIHKSKI